MRKKPKKTAKKAYSVFPQELRLKVVGEIESGRLSVDQARAKYNIKHPDTIQSWLFKYGKDPGAFVKRK